MLVLICFALLILYRYGPFWIVSTLVFLMAAMGNLSRFLNREATDTGEWENDIKKISEAATLLYSLSAFLPCFLYFLFRNWTAERGFIELVAIYGYSLLPFIPACVCIIILVCLFVVLLVNCYDITLYMCMCVVCF